MSMNVDYGGCQPKMHATLIKDLDDYCGPFYDDKLHGHVKIGEEQELNFASGEKVTEEDGPFWMSKDERLRTRNDVYEDIPIEKQKPSKKIKNELMEELVQKGVTLRSIQVSKWKAKELQQLAENHGVDLYKHPTRKLKVKGWLGQPKGLKQVLWVRGWLDVSQLPMYKNICVNDNGEELHDLSIIQIMESCLDFANELTQIEYVVQNLDSSSVLITTKYHAELAGEGCEYTWGVAKSRFRRIKMSEKLNKKTKEDFVANVKKCLSTEKSLCPYNIRRFSRRERSYMLLGI